jgi:hypothetical protein
MAYGQQTSLILIIHLECCGSLQGGQCAFSIPLGLADMAKGIFPYAKIGTVIYSDAISAQKSGPVPVFALLKAGPGLKPVLIFHIY